MSIHALSWVLKYSEAQGGGRLVMLVLADHAKDDGTCSWPSVATIAHEARMSRRAVQQQLRNLETLGAIERMGESRNRTVIWRVVMGGAGSSPLIAEEGADSALGRAQISTNEGEAASPKPSGTVQQQPSKTTSSSSRKRILEPDEEPTGFAQWLGQHVAICERWGVARSVPRAGTSARSDLARMFAALLEEGYRLEDFETVSEVVLASDFNRENDHTKFSTVLRKSKFGERIDDGWKAREAASVAQAQGERLGQYDGLVSN